MAERSIQMGNAANQAKSGARGAMTSPAAIALERAGLATRGVVYIVIGVLAVMLAFGRGGGATGSSGAIKSLDGLPFGKGLVILIAIGLFGYALFSLSRAIFNTDQQPSGTKGMVSRVGAGVAGISYGALGWGALQLGLGSSNGGQGSGSKEQAGTAKALTLPFGAPVIVIIGLIVVGFGIAQFYRAWDGGFLKQLRLDQLPAQTKKAVVNLGRAGVAARGVVAGIVGIFLIVAALHRNPGEAKGVGGALGALAVQPFGKVLLAAVALGLVAFGVFSLVQARYRQLNGQAT